MKVTTIAPRGFCHGVVSAWATAQKVAKENKGSRPIYMVGQLVHNRHLVSDMEKSGITLLSDLTSSRAQLIDEIKEKDAIVIFSAHGTDYKVIEAAKKRGFEVHDTTCSEVTITHDLIKAKLKDRKQVLFIGKKNHPETLGVLAIDPSIILIETPEDVKNLQIRDKDIFVTNQTTLSIYDTYEVAKAIRARFTNFEFVNDLCTATKQRQEAVINMSKEIDVLLVVGDKRSNNSNKLVEIARANGTEAYLVDNFKEIKPEWLLDKKNVGVTSGASTPTYLTTEVINYIKEL